MRIVFLDIETTGLDPIRHYPIDVALKICDPTARELHASYQSLVQQPWEIWEKHDPHSQEIHRYTWEDIREGLNPSTIEQALIALFEQYNIRRGHALFICQNPAFDRSFLAHIVNIYTQVELDWPYHWLDLASMYWLSLMKKGPVTDPLDLSKDAIAQALGLPTETKPHHAVNGVDHLRLCYATLLGYTL